MTCKRCKSDDIVKGGFVLRARGRVQRYFCKKCNCIFTD